MVQVIYKPRSNFLTALMLCLMYQMPTIPIAV